MIHQGSNIIHRISSSSAVEASYYRLLKNKRVSLVSIIGHIVSSLRNRVANRHVLIISDSTEISLKACMGKLRDGHRVGVLSDNKTPGFHMHVSMCLDACSGHGLGLSDILLWNRSHNTQTRVQRDKQRKSQPWSGREFYKWYLGMKHSLEVVTGAKQVTFIFDTEADFNNLWQKIQQAQTDAIIRLHRDWEVMPLSSRHFKPKQKLKAYLETLPYAEKNYLLKLRPLNRRNYSRGHLQNRQGRLAKIHIRFTPVRLARLAQYSRPLYIIEAKEDPQTVPQGEAPIHWLLLSTHQVDSFEKAYQIIQWYCQRWMIEQLFRLSKKQGFRIEQSQLEYLDAIMKQTTTTMEAAFQVMQLLLARDKKEDLKTTEIFSEDQIQCLEALNLKYQGKTKKQQNPHLPTQLAWATWIIARLGGWKGYQKARPPGPIRIKRGLERFNTIYQGWIIHQDKNLC